MPKRILIADDDPGIGDMLQLMLEDAGYEAEIEVNGQSVWQLAEPFPDLLILDIRLSGMDGRTICEQPKCQPATSDIPIIILSAHKDTQQIAREAGANDFLVKPFDMADLLSLVAKYVGRE